MKKPAPSPLYSVSHTIRYYYPDPGVYSPLVELAGLAQLHIDLIRPEVYTCLQVCFTYMCRVSELLNTHTTDLIGCNRVYVKGRKESRSYTIHLPGIDNSFAPGVKVSDDERLFPFTYQQVYRACHRIGIVDTNKTTVNQHITHLSRYIVGQKVNSIASLSGVADVLRHRYKTSAHHYVRKESKL